MKTVLLIVAFWLCPAGLFAAQSITLQPGDTPFGPLAVNPSINRFARFQISRWIGPNITLDAAFWYSDDNQKTWKFLCGFTAQGATVAGLTISKECPLFDQIDVGGKTQRRLFNATHIKGNAAVAGGTITISIAPSINLK